jgi:hypothetical protein
MKTYAKIVFVLFVIFAVSALVDTSMHGGAFWVGYIVAAPLLWALPIRGVVWVYNRIFNHKPVQS